MSVSIEWGNVSYYLSTRRRKRIDTMEEVKHFHFRQRLLQIAFHFKYARHLLSMQTLDTDNFSVTTILANTFLRASQVETETITRRMKVRCTTESDLRHNWVVAITYQYFFKHLLFLQAHPAPTSLGFFVKASGLFSKQF